MAKAKQMPVKATVEGAGPRTFQPGEIAQVVFKDEDEIGGVTIGPVTFLAPSAARAEGEIRLRPFGQTLAGEYPLKGWYKKPFAIKVAKALGARFVEG